METIRRHIFQAYKLPFDIPHGFWIDRSRGEYSIEFVQHWGELTVCGGSVQNHPAAIGRHRSQRFFPFDCEPSTFSFNPRLYLSKARPGSFRDHGAERRQLVISKDRSLKQWDKLVANRLWSDTFEQGSQRGSIVPQIVALAPMSE